MTPWTVWPALGQPVYMRPDSVNGSIKSGVVFASAGERRALLLRMGSAPKSWAYLDTLARASGISPNALKPKLEALEQEGIRQLNERSSRPQIPTDRGWASLQGGMSSRRIV